MSYQAAFLHLFAGPSMAATLTSGLKMVIPLGPLDVGESRFIDAFYLPVRIKSPSFLYILSSKI